MTLLDYSNIIKMSVKYHYKNIRKYIWMIKECCWGSITKEGYLCQRVNSRLSYIVIFTWNWVTKIATRFFYGPNLKKLVKPWDQKCNVIKYSHFLIPTVFIIHIVINWYKVSHSINKSSTLLSKKIHHFQHMILTSRYSQINKSKTAKKTIQLLI